MLIEIHISKRGGLLFHFQVNRHDQPAICHYEFIAVVKQFNCLWREEEGVNPEATSFRIKACWAKRCAVQAWNGNTICIITILSKEPVLLHWLFIRQWAKIKLSAVTRNANLEQENLLNPNFWKQWSYQELIFTTCMGYVRKEAVLSLIFGTGVI